MQGSPRRVLLWRLLLWFTIASSFAHAATWLFESSAVAELDEDTLQQAIDGSKPLIVNFYAPWCPHCQHFAPIYKNIAKQFEDSPVLFAAVNCVEYGSLCRSNGIRGYPSVKVWRMGGKEPGARIPNNENDIVEFITKALADGSLQVAAGKADDRFEDRDARLNDAVNALEFVLRQEWPSNAKQTAAMSALLVAAFSYLPEHKAARYYILHQTFVQMTSDGRKLQEEAWKAALDTVEPLPKDIEDYRLCEVTSDGGYRFTCGLWQLFHIMSVGASKRFSQEPERKPIQLVETIRQFVDQLFKCEQCKSHFLKEYDGCQHGRCSIEDTDSKGVMLWLWRMHNSVTVRTKQDGSSLQWPPVASCNACRKENMVAWEEAYVARYIEHGYWSASWQLFVVPSTVPWWLLLAGSFVIVAGLLFYGVNQRKYLLLSKKVLEAEGDDSSRLEEGDASRVDRESAVYRRK